VVCEVVGYEVLFVSVFVDEPSVVLSTCTTLPLPPPSLCRLRSPAEAFPFFEPLPLPCFLCFKQKTKKTITTNPSTPLPIPSKRYDEARSNAGFGVGIGVGVGVGVGLMGSDGSDGADGCAFSVEVEMVMLIGVE
jgi:hypothetical protein